MKWTTEAKVGLFTLIGIALFSACIIFLGRFDIWATPAMHISGNFQSVTGLKEGNAVRFSGVKVGKVTSMAVTEQGITVAMDIDKDVHIPNDSLFTMESDGILGDKFIQISPGKSKDYLTTGSTVSGNGKSELDKTMAQATELMEAATKTLHSINGVIGDTRTQNALRNALESTELIAQNTANLTAQMNDLLAQNSDQLTHITNNMVGITRNMESLTAQMDANLQQFNADGQAGTEMRQIVTNLKTTTDSISKMANAMEGVVTDPQSAEDLKETLHNTAQLSSKLNRLTGGDVKGGDGKKSDLKVQVGSEALYNRIDKTVQLNSQVRFMKGKEIYELGIRDFGHGSNLELQYGKRIFSDISVRGGLFDGELGVGLDYGLGKSFSLSSAYYGLNHGNYRLRSDIRLFSNTYLVGQWVKDTQTKKESNFWGLRTVF